MSDEKKLLEAEVELLKSHINENKIYIEITFISLFFIIITFLSIQDGITQINNGTTYAYIIMITTLTLLFIGFYLLFHTLYKINRKIDEIKVKQKGLIRNWLDND